MQLATLLVSTKALLPLISTLLLATSAQAKVMPRATGAGAGAATPNRVKVMSSSSKVRKCPGSAIAYDPALVSLRAPVSRAGLSNRLGAYLSAAAFAE